MMSDKRTNKEAMNPIRSRYLCKLDSLKEGMKLGQDIIYLDRKVLLAAGTVLTAAHIKHLCDLNIQTIIIQPEAELDSDTEYEHFSRSYEQIFTRVKSAFEHVRIFNEVPLAQMQELVRFSINPITETIGVIEYLHKIQKQDDYTYQHSLNVAIIAGVIGKWCKYQGRELADLILAGLLHDIGKVKVPLDILNKPGKLTGVEMQEIKKHPGNGYQLVQKLDISSHVKTAIWQHHERHDGSGYPKGLKQPEICDYASIIAVADIYDAMTTNRVYRAKQTPLVAAEILAEQMYDQLDPYICNVFLDYLKKACIGAQVRLSDGRNAKIIHIDPQRIGWPIIQTAEGQIIDLEREKAIDLLEFL